MAINLGYRPRSLFWPLTAETHLLSTIKGAERRAMVESILNSGDLEALSAFITRSALEHDERTAFGRLHPSFMGGEYLPDLDEGEIEIARINIASTTSDVTSVYAHRTPKGISYRVVDEYNGETLSGKATCFSEEPLTLGQLADFFLDAWPLIDVLDMNELNREASQRFVRPSSALYPEFAALIRQKIRECRPE